MYLELIVSVFRMEVCSILGLWLLNEFLVVKILVVEVDGRWLCVFWGWGLFGCGGGVWWEGVSGVVVLTCSNVFCYVNAILEDSIPVMCWYLWDVPGGFFGLGIGFGFHADYFRCCGIRER